MPRKPYNASEKIIESLEKGRKNWSELLRETGLSKAALSTNLKNLIGKSIVTTEVNSSARPPTTIYVINAKARLGRLTTPLYPRKRETPEKISERVRRLIGKWASEDQKTLSRLIRNYIAIEVSRGSANSLLLFLSTDEDADTESPPDERITRMSKKEIHQYFFNEILSTVKGWLKTHGLDEVKDEAIQTIIEDMMREGIFTIGVKQFYGIKVPAKSSDIWDKAWEEVRALYEKAEEEIKPTI